MENVSPGMIAIVIGVILLILLFSRTARIIAVVAAILFIALAAGPAILRSKSCVNVGGSCLIQPAYAGPCFPKNGSAVLKVDGNYYIVSPEPESARATCLDWRVWK